MSTTKLFVLISIFVLFSVSAFAVDGVVLINQASVMAAGGFPYVISNSGSYRLSGNLTVPSGLVDGIDITVDNVTLDLNGFTISGPLTCDGGATTTTTTCTGSPGLGVFASTNNVTVRNGTIRGMDTGILIEGAGALVEEVHAFNNHGGIELFASGVVRRNTANNNGSQGGIFAETSVISQNVANGNLSSGIIAIESVVSENTAWLNGEEGIIADTSKVSDNASNRNFGFGLLIFGGLYGSNQFQDNTKGSVNGSGVSQHNNNCAGSLC